jgi:hypothetical protein
LFFFFAFLVGLPQFIYSQERTSVAFAQQKSSRLSAADTFYVKNGVHSDPGDENWDDRFGPNDDLDDYDEMVYAIAIADSEIYIGGGFWVKDASYWNHIAKWNGRGWSSLGRGVDKNVNTLAVLDSDLYVGGIFTKVDGIIPANNIAKWNRVAKTWSVLESGGKSGVNAGVGAFAVHGNELYVGGDFTQAGGVNANHIAKWNPSTETWTPLGDGVNGSVTSIAVSDTELYVGGYFTSASGVPANNIAKWNGYAWSPLGGGVNSTVRALAFFENAIYVGGFFTNAGGIDVNGVAKWSAIDNSWSVLGGGIINSRGTISWVAAIGSIGNAVYLGGTFDMADGQRVNNIAKWNPDSNSWSACGSGLSSQVFALATHGNDVYVGGTFRRAGGKPSDRFAIWHEPPQPDNRAPAWHNLPDVTFQEDKKAKLNLNQFVSDVDDTLAALTFRAEVIAYSQSSLQNGKLNSSPAAGPNDLRITIDPATHIATFKASKDSFGVFTVVFTVADPQGLSDSDTIQVTVTPVNDAPVIAAPLPGLTFGEEEIIFYNYSNWFNYVEDADDADTALTFSVVSGAHVIATLELLSYRFTAPVNWFGNDTLRLIVADRGGLADTAALMIKVTPLNDAPVIASLPELTFEEDDSLLYPLRNWYDYVTDVDDTDSTLTFKVLSGKHIKAVQRAESFLFMAPPNWFGTNTLKLIVKDRGRLADTATFAIKVKSTNDAPVISGLPDSLSFRNDAAPALQIWDFVEDVETPDSLLNYAFAASKDSLLMNFNPETGTLRLQAPDFSGLVDLFMTVTDDQRATVHDTIAVQVETTTSVAASDNQIPTEFVLFQNYPNPFNPTTLIRFGLPHATEVRLEVYDLSGRRVATLLNERKPAGYHAVELDARNLSSGTYFYRLTAGRFSAMKKLMLLH